MFKIVQPPQFQRAEHRGEDGGRVTKLAVVTAQMQDWEMQAAVISSTVRPTMLRVGFKTLVVEHRDEVFARIASDLSKMKARVARAVSATDAASMVASLSPDLVVANCELPDESGWLMVAKWQITRRPWRVWMYANYPNRYDAAWLGFSKVERIVYYRGDLWQLTELIGTHLEESLY